MTGNPTVELAARMPWTVAEPETWWEVTGDTSPKNSFTHCLARVLPTFITGSEEPIFEVLVYGCPFHVKASAITHARQLELVYTDEYDQLRSEAAW
ncbi:MAG: hypothetical protein ACRDUA_08535 [Micromonosporaceae bacterium]